MVVGIDARAAAEVPAGRGRVVRELLLALDALKPPHRFRLFCREPWNEVSLGAQLEWVPIGLPDPLWHARAAVEANRSCDVFFSTNSYLTAWMLRVPCAVLVHDLIAFLPHAPARKGAARIERATIRPAIRRAESLVCNSLSTERDLIRFFPRAAGRTAVIPFAAEERFHRERSPAELTSVTERFGVQVDGFVFATGTLEPRKNLLRLIRAHAGLAPARRDHHPLLIAGPRGWEEKEVVDAAAGSEHVKLAGFVSDDDLAALYSACAVFAYPSLYEGFGLPVLEAMAAGAAVVTADNSSLPEVGGDAVVYVQAEDESSITLALENLLTDPGKRAALGARARQRARSFSWERVARSMIGELERVASAANTRR